MDGLLFEACRYFLQSDGSWMTLKLKVSDLHGLPPMQKIMKRLLICFLDSLLMRLTQWRLLCQVRSTYSVDKRDVLLLARKKGASKNWKSCEATDIEQIQCLASQLTNLTHVLHWSICSKQAGLVKRTFSHLLGIMGLRKPTNQKILKSHVL